METIDRKKYNKPVIVVVKVGSIRLLAGSDEAKEADINDSRSFRNSFFEDDE